MPYIEVVVTPKFVIVQLDMATGSTAVLGMMEDRAAARAMLASLSGLRFQLRHVRGDGSVRYPDVVHGIKEIKMNGPYTDVFMYDRAGNPIH